VGRVLWCVVCVVKGSGHVEAMNVVRGGEVEGRKQKERTNLFDKPTGGGASLRLPACAVNVLCFAACPSLLCWRAAADHSR